MLKIHHKNLPSTEIGRSLSKSLEIVLSSASASAFHEITQRSHLFSESEQLGSFLKKNYLAFVIIGIGGSSMGARAITEITGSKKIYFLDNVDSNEFSTVITEIKDVPEKTAFLMISKSGSTIEILWNYSALQNAFKQKFNIDIIKNSFFISELVSNTLSDFARLHKRPLLEIPTDIGGRFSVLTPVGLVIAQICGLDLQKIKIGANNALSSQSLILQFCELIENSFLRNENISLFWFYNSKYRWFGAWLQQLWAESLGKKETRTGEKAPDFSTPMIAIGSSDQHSILQQVVHGPKDKYVCIFDFMTVSRSEWTVPNPLFKEIDFMKDLNYGDLIANQSKATIEALKLNQVSCDLFSVNDQNTAECLGFLFMYFQLVVATLGELHNINAYDQPGVALGKEITLSFLKKRF